MVCMSSDGIFMLKCLNGIILKISIILQVFCVMKAVDIFETLILHVLVNFYQNKYTLN